MTPTIFGTKEVSYEIVGGNAKGPSTRSNSPKDQGYPFNWTFDSPSTEVINETVGTINHWNLLYRKIKELVDEGNLWTIREIYILG